MNSVKPFVLHWRKSKYLKDISSNVTPIKSDSVRTYSWWRFIAVGLFLLLDLKKKTKKQRNAELSDDYWFFKNVFKKIDLQF